MISQDESIMVAWCDGGRVDGKFTLGLVAAMMHLKQKFNLRSFARVCGNQIARQRHEVFLEWEKEGSEWLLWVDSDVVFSTESLDILMQYAHKDLVKVISGVYFILEAKTDASLPAPTPAIFKEDELKRPITIHPLPNNELIEIDHAGFGFLLMHKSIIEKIKSVSPGSSVFDETLREDLPFIGEDIKFFMNLKKAGIQSYAHTGALAEHMKIFAVDNTYYNAFWGKDLKTDDRSNTNTK
jgi:GT2 family glycosyltransferase